MGRIIFLGEKWSWESWVSTCKRLKSANYPLSTIYKNLLNKDLINIKTTIIKFLEENLRGKLCGTGFGNEILDMTPKAQITTNR